MQMVYAVPEGGNWKDIPEHIPSKRLDQIRKSFARGEGSRSTYYGRLRRTMPSYTINTYFNRPGNGCHIHYEQDRVISQREAARLQSFPDSFEFFGSQGAIYKQIGNAVPPLLAFQIAKTLGEPGFFIDLFAGAGGMGLGFKWAGWTPVIANDIEPKYLETYAKNVHNSTIEGSINNPEVFKTLVSVSDSVRSSGCPFWVLGGPPCQGFSTAGNKRTMDDPRNHLAWDYVDFLKQVQPDGFVFENVMGLLNMQKGKVYSAVRDAFSIVMSSINGQKLSAEEYGIPQRRKRVFLVGQKDPNAASWAEPDKFTSAEAISSGLFCVQPAVSVEEALSDLPAISAGENGSDMTYKSPPANVYQALMRGLISPQEYLTRIKTNKRRWQTNRNTQVGSPI